MNPFLQRRLMAALIVATFILTLTPVEAVHADDITVNGTGCPNGDRTSEAGDYFSTPQQVGSGTYYWVVGLRLNSNLSADGQQVYLRSSLSNTTAGGSYASVIRYSAGNDTWFHNGVSSGEISNVNTVRSAQLSGSRAIFTVQFTVTGNVWLFHRVDAQAEGCYIEGATVLGEHTFPSDYIKIFRNANSLKTPIGFLIDSSEPTVPTVILSGDIAFRDVTLSWTVDREDTTGFNLTRLSPNGDITSYTFSGETLYWNETVPTNGRYQYNISASNANGTGAISDNLLLISTTRPIAGENGIIYGQADDGLTARQTLANTFGVSENGVDLLLAILIIVIASVGLASRFGRGAGVFGAFGGVALSYGLQLIPTWLIILLLVVAVVPIMLMGRREN